MSNKVAFRNPRVVPPGGRYFYEVPETKVYLEAPTFAGLLTGIARHYETNGSPVPVGLDSLVVAFMCARLPKGFCTGNIEPVVRIVSLAQIREATQRLWSGCGGSVVTPGEAMARGQVCGACACNDRTLCPTCIGLVDWGLSLVRKTRSGFEAWLGVCTVDNAALSAKVYMRLTKPGAEPANCWRHE